MGEPTTLTTDPEVLALLDFEPVPRARAVEGGWTRGLPGRSCAPTTW